MTQENASKQRAVLMGLMAVILQDDELSVDEIKIRVVHTFGTMIDLDIMVGDVIDILVATACKEYLEQQGAVQEAEEILKKN